MDKRDCIRIGTIGKVHGTKGELSFIQEEVRSLDPKNLTSFFIEIDQQLVPFFIQTANRQNKRFLLKLDGVNTIEQAVLLKNSAVYIPSPAPSEKAPAESDFEQCIGYSVTDSVQGRIGILEEVITLANQKLLKVMHPKQIEILIPARKEFISKIDLAGKNLEMITPEGLLEVYLK